MAVSDMVVELYPQFMIHCCVAEGWYIEGSMTQWPWEVPSPVMKFGSWKCWGDLLRVHSQQDPVRKWETKPEIPNKMKQKKLTDVERCTFSHRFRENAKVIWYSSRSRNWRRSFERGMTSYVSETFVTLCVQLLGSRPWNRSKTLR